MDSNEALKEAFYRTFTDDPVNWIKWGVVLVILVVGYVIAIPLYGKVRYRIGWERKRDIARQRNHIIKAILIDNWRSGNTGAYDCHATYQYSVNGKQKTYRALFVNRQSPPRILYLYYLNNPNKLFSYDEYHWENHKAVVLLPVMLLPWIMAIAAVFLLKIEIPGL